MDLQISSLVSYLMKISAFLVYAICFLEAVLDKQCLDECVGKDQNVLGDLIVKQSWSFKWSLDSLYVFGQTQSWLYTPISIKVPLVNYVS